MSEPKGPCPIPSCALEVMLGGLVAAIGGGLMFADPRSAIISSLAIPTVPDDHTRYAWAIVLLLGGAGQAVALRFRLRQLHRWMALVNFLLAAAVSILIFNSPHRRVVLWWPISLVALGEVYIYWMLRGARWSGSAS